MFRYDYGKATKLQYEDENPIDRIFISASEGLCPHLKLTGTTPNLITTVCVVASVLAARSIHLGNKRMFVFWAIFAYFMDCLDGHFARKYNMCTVFGDYYDHITDWIYYGLVFYAAFYVRGFKPTYKPYSVHIYVIIFLATIGMMWHFGCQEKVYRKKNKNTVPGKSRSLQSTAV